MKCTGFTAVKFESRTIYVYPFRLSIILHNNPWGILWRHVSIEYACHVLENCLKDRLIELALLLPGGNFLSTKVEATLLLDSSKRTWNERLIS